jgi:hypothetical protein
LPQNDLKIALKVTIVYKLHKNCPSLKITYLKITSTIQIAFEMPQYCGPNILPQNSLPFWHKHAKIA